MCSVPGGVSVNAKALSAPITCSAHFHTRIPHVVDHLAPKLYDILDEFTEVSHDRIECGASQIDIYMHFSRYHSPT
jgi:hypothetical protein